MVKTNPKPIAMDCESALVMSYDGGPKIVSIQSFSQALKHTHLQQAHISSTSYAFHKQYPHLTQ